MLDIPLALRILPGKSGRNGLFLPSWEHMLDTAHCIDWLFEARYPGIYRDSGLSREEFRRYLRLVAFLHDIGKFTPAFICRILRAMPEYRGLLEHYGVPLPYCVYDPKAMHHGASGEAILLDLGCPKGFASVVGAHHGMPRPSDMENIRNHMNSHKTDYWFDDEPFWRGIWSENLGLDLSVEATFGESAIRRIARPRAEREAMRGVTVRAFDELSRQSGSREDDDMVDGVVNAVDGLGT